MGLIPDQGHLSVLDPVFETTRKRTHPGMAHFAESGPARKTCRECEFWTGCGREAGYYAKKGVHGGTLKPRPCAKYRDMMQEIGPGVPFNALACKYFAESKLPPSVSEKA